MFKVIWALEKISYNFLRFVAQKKNVLYTSHHRRRMEREAKAKVVASVWGADFVQFLAALAILPRSIWKKRMNSAEI